MDKALLKARMMERNLNNTEANTKEEKIMTAKQVTANTIMPAKITPRRTIVQASPAQDNTEALRLEIERMRQENAMLKAQSSRALAMKVSDKGGLSVYGLGRFPVTLYKEQWLKLLERADEIKAFIAANDSKLSVKSQH